MRLRHPKFSPQASTRLRLKPLASAIALVMIAGSAQAAPAAFSAGWMAAKGAAQQQGGAMPGAGGGMQLPGTPPPLAQQAKVNQQLQHSLANMNNTVAAIAAQQAAQAAGRSAALARPQTIPDGLGEGGLQIDGSVPFEQAWHNAKGPVQTEQGGKVHVGIEQTADKAILNWETFNVGRNTTVEFQQQADWAVLNRVNDPNARPSQIQGQIKADGTVMIANANGVVFTGSSQVNVRNLATAAANITDQQFTDNGLYGTNNAATFTAAGGNVVVEQGAQIATAQPENSTTGGGYVLLLGKDVDNAGSITTANGQTLLAGGDSFVIKRGQGTGGNPASSTRGNEVTATGTGTVTNSGLIQSATGDITLTGNQVTQAGVALASTSVHNRGTVHLNATGANANVTLAEGATTAILLEDTDATALDGQRDSQLAPAVDNTEQNIVAGDKYRRDQSLVEVTSTGTVDFQADSITLATGGQVAIDAADRTLVRDGATIDVSGATGVKVAMENNTVKVNIQGNEQRDSSVNRDSGNLNSTDVWIDTRELVFVPAGTNGYESDRWYTAGGLLEVGGYLGTAGHSVGEWMAQGGTVSFTGNDLVTQQNSQINLSGGTLDVQSGTIKQTWLKGADGRLYELSRAPGDLLYTGVYQGYEDRSERWGQTDYYYNPLLAPRERAELGYTVGRDAGKLIVGTANAVLEGQLVGDTYQGERQTEAAQAGLDGYHQSQNAVARGAQLIVGTYTPYYVKDSGTLQYALGANANTIKNVILGNAADSIANALELDTALPEDRQGTLYLDNDQLNGFELGALKVAATEGITVDNALQVAPAGNITLYGTDVSINADLSARAGTIHAGNTLTQITPNGMQSVVLNGNHSVGTVQVAEGVTLDASGLWSNLLLDPQSTSNLPYQNGGSISIRSSGDVNLGAGSLIDVTSGAALQTDGSLQGARGGNVTLAASDGRTGGSLTMDGDIHGYGVNGGGTLQIETGSTVIIGDQPLLEHDGFLQAGQTAPINLWLSEPYAVAAGEILLEATNYDHVITGQQLPSAISFADTGQTVNIVVGPGGWDLTGTDMDVHINGSNTASNRYRGHTGTRTVVPEGAVITRIRGGSLPEGYLIPDSLGGLPTPTYSVAAGQPAPMDTILLAAGSMLPAGTALGQRVAVQAPLMLQPDFFDKGFSHYDVIGQRGVMVSEGAEVNVSMPVLRLTEQAQGLVSGGSSATALQPWIPPLHLDDPDNSRLHQRAGASLALKSGSASSTQADIATNLLHIARGAVINVDPGQSIALQGIGQITVDGTLNAWGGSIELRQGTVSGSADIDSANNEDGRSIWIGETARLDAAARAVTAVNAQGQRYGQVSNGGSIVIGGSIDHAARDATLPVPFVVVRDGALLDASGTSALLDIPGHGATRVASHGGSISLASGSGLYLDGDMRAYAGGAGAAGGSLSVAMGVRAAGPQTPDRLRQIHELVIAQQQGSSELPEGINANEAAPTLVYGYARVGADQVEAGGFDTLSLLSKGMLAFDGNVNLALGQRLNLYAGALGVTEASGADSRVNLTAPYMRLAGSLAPTSPDSPGYFLTGMSYGVTQPVSQQPAAGSLRLEAGYVLDIEAGSGLGSGGSLNLTRLDGSNELVDRRAFDSTQLVSHGDQRFAGGILYIPGDLTLAAAQLYPTIGASATIHAGWRGTSADYDPGRRLVIARTTDSTPAMPYSAFGSLTLGAATVDQGGIVRAPLGTLNIGYSRNQQTRTVNLLPGSLTSVSAGGLLLPYGGTVDGITWQYDGQDISLLGVGGTTAGNSLQVGMTLIGELVDIQQGATVDLSGGGELLGAAFVSGRGGSTDARFNPLVQNGLDGFTLPGLNTNPVYAILPGVQPVAAPAGGEAGASDPMLGQQITIGNGVPGLAAGTYTLLPSTYALLPGAYRVELNGLAGQGAVTPAQALRNGSWAASGTLSVAGTGIRDSLASQLILTPADTLRSYSQYNEMSYADFVQADAARLGVPRAMLEADGRTLQLQLHSHAEGEVGLQVDGSVLGRGSEGGYHSTLVVEGRGQVIVDGMQNSVEILADGDRADTRYAASVYASDLSAMDVGRIAIGLRPWVAYGQAGNHVEFAGNTVATSIVLRSGAELSAPEVMLIARQRTGGSPGTIEIEQGASIITLGQGAAPYDSDDGFIYQAGDKSVLAVSNGRLQWLAPETGTNFGPGSILVGTCTVGGCEGETRLYSEGSIAFATDNTFELDDAVRYGTRHLTLAVGSFNIGSAEALAAASTRDALTPGLTLNQDILQRLLQGDTSAGAPALETLELVAGDALNFFDSVTLSTLDGQGQSLLDNLLLTTPAIYGYGDASDVALIQTSNLIWNGSAERPGAVAANGAGTGSGSLTIDAERIEFGYGPFSQPSGVDDLGRLALGFANVNLNASERMTANNKGSLAVYQSQGTYVPGEGVSYSGGNLNIHTPLLTGAAGSVNHITAGGAVTVTAPEGATAAAVDSEALGAELAITGHSLLLDTAVVLPSGKLVLTAEDDLTLAAGAQLDMAGRSIEFHDDEDATQYSWGGDVTLHSTSGDIRQAADSSIDLSAEYNQGGRLTAIALDDNAGLVDLQGQILGSASGYYEAGGTWVPYAAGGVDIRAQQLGGSGSPSDQFAALNQRLNDGEVLGMRHFQLKQGDLTIGDELKANDVSVSVDGGHLTVAGTIDASGERVGSIRLAGKQGLTLTGNALLDAHGKTLRLDSYGKIIDSPNRAVVELSSGDGQLLLADGAGIDLRHGTADARVQTNPSLHDNRDRGTLELNAPRLGGATAGDIDIDASGRLNIQGARSIAVNAVQRYDDAAYGSDDAASGRPYQIIDQAYLDAKHADSEAFINAALSNDQLLSNKLAGLNNTTYADAFRLRPGVEIVSATADGDMIVSGDLDLSGHRYASLNPHTPHTSVIGSGEVGNLVIRAGGDLDIYGSINDGFAPPPDTPDDNGWVLTPGYIAYGGDVVVPGPGVTLAAGTEFAAGKTLNYDLPIGATQFTAGTQLPVDTVLDAALTLPADSVLHAPIYDASGNQLYAAGSILGEAITLPANTRLGAGTVLPANARLQAMLWPKGAALPSVLTLVGDLALPRGALIPSETLVVLPDDAISTPLRPANGDSQGKNWAVAAMLPEGSQSWSMRIVAGADTQAADSRLTRKEAEGSLILADTHYTLLNIREVLGALFWASGNRPGRPVGEAVDDASLWLCDRFPGSCVSATHVWAEGNPLGRPEGHAVPENMLIACDRRPGACVELETGLGGLLASYPAAQAFSVLRTGVGDLDMIAGGDMHMQSLYGVYTAGKATASRAEGQATGFNQPRALAGDGSYLGTSNGADESVNAGYEALVDDGTNSTYAAWYPDGGGNLLLRAGGNLTGDMLATNRPLGLDRELRGQSSSANLGNWLWRQGTGSTQGVEPVSTSWWINFGTYVGGGARTNAYYSVSGIESVPELVGFTGFGALGGGDLTVDIAGDAGMLSSRGGGRVISPRSQGLALAVGSTGRVTADGELLLTGGGDMYLRIGGDLNPGLQARVTDNDEQNMNLTGVLTNLRGSLQLHGGALGGVALSYGSLANRNDVKEIRPYDSFSSTRGMASGGPVVMLGDAVASLNARGDLVLTGTGDPGRVITKLDALPADTSWFSLWTDNTAINLFSAGGNLTPSVQLSNALQNVGGNGGHNYSTTDGRFVYPSQLSTVAANGSIYMGTSAIGSPLNPLNTHSMLLAPSLNGSLQLLAGDSIFAGGYVISQSGVSLDAMPTPFAPAFARRNANGQITLSNMSSDSISSVNSLFVFGPNTTAGAEWGSAIPARFYAGEDIVGLRTGEILTFTGGSRMGQTWYESAGPVWMMAGRDIVNSGTALGESTSMPSIIGIGNSTGNLFVHNDPNDVSIVSAGRDILYSSFNVAGPGTLEITAGRNILMEDRAAVTSLGPVVPGDSRPGAGIVMQAGYGAQGADYLGFAERYLDPANLADPELALAEQEGKVARTYEAELADWLAERYGFIGEDQQALDFYAALPTEQQRIFARDVYFAELRAAGREYNEVDGLRQGSYLRGRNAIAALFPTHDVAGNEIAYGGDILMYGGAGVHTNVGGGIQMLTPGGQQVFGVEGEAPPGTAGVITRGQGDIQLYSLDDILLGQSRIMTTFGGDILAWSAEGDINAGRGSKTTVVYTPPRREYDNWGNVSLAPVVPSSGAGIATLNPIAEVPPGDIDLLAPLGTIDAGEAGIRVSGNVNIAALQVINAANIQVQGESSGIPVVASVNTGALTAASAAASSAVQAVDDVVRESTAQRRPSVFSARVISFGDERMERGNDEASLSPAQQPDELVRVLGAGELDEQALNMLTAEERARLLM
ncbi:filamentous hemagglutinin family protein [Pseudomonas aestusnigri]|uniref:filamentous hemagglutinin family protein n=1 Tax=Halopseudomonas aestusnigri TaxID=857252 RepID=UPI001D18E153|nr:filamentous hemagglutinin family protein [Halopseudomonas aestusnigri]MCC4261624.1 filamentous hemagglutinin family protein [Halopseudomonas aestusnigri]